MVLVHRAALTAIAVALLGVAADPNVRDADGFTHMTSSSAEMRCVLDEACAVRFPPGESLVRYVPPVSGWQIGVFDHGGPQHEAELEIRPLRGAQESNLIVKTDGGRYEIILRPAMRGDYSRIQFAHVPVATIGVTTAPTASPMDIVAAECRTMPHTYEYRFEGKASFIPLAGWSDGWRSCFQMPTMMVDAPVVYRRTVAGDEEVTYHAAEGYYLTDVAGDRFVFVLGAGKRDELAIAVKR